METKEKAILELFLDNGDDLSQKQKLLPANLFENDNYAVD